MAAAWARDADADILPEPPDALHAQRGAFHSALARPRRYSRATDRRATHALRAQAKKASGEENQGGPLRRGWCAETAEEYTGYDFFCPVFIYNQSVIGFN